jgi:hypothetical protein
MLMRKASRQPRQLWDLFHQPLQVPIWAKLPRPVQRRVKELLAHLFDEERKHRATPARGKERSHE